MIQICAPAYIDIAFVAEESNHLVLRIRRIYIDGNSVSVFVAAIRAAVVFCGIKICRARIVHAESPLYYVEMVRAPVAVFALPVFVEATPASALIAFYAE